MSRSRVVVVASALALAAAALFVPSFAHDGHSKPAVGSFDPNAPKRVSAATALAIGLATAEIDFGRVEEVVRLTGTVQSRPGSLHAIAPQYSGVVRSIPVQPGDRVVTGEILAEIESPELARSVYEVRKLEAEVEKLRSEIAHAESQVTALEIEVPAFAKSADLLEAEIQRLLDAAESIPANLFAQRKADALRLRADADLRAVSLRQARAEVESLRLQFAAARASADALRGTLPRSDDPIATAHAEPSRPGILRFTSPIKGVVVARTLLPGSGFAANTTLLTVGNIESVQIEGELPEGLIDRVANARNASVRIRQGLSRVGAPIAEGIVRFISPVIDPVSRTAHLIIDAPNGEGKLRPGQFVDLAVVLSQNENVVVAPSSAIVSEGPLRYVFVREGTGDREVFVKRDIAVGIRDDRVVEIRDGLVPGDVIVVEGAWSLAQLRGSSEQGADGSTAEAEGARKDVTHHEHH